MYRPLCHTVKPIPLAATVRRIGLLASLLPLLAIAAPVKLDIAAQPLASALNHLAEQSGLQIIYDGQIVQGKSSQGIRGAQEPQAALEQLLEGSGLTWRSTGAGSVVLEPRPASGGTLEIGATTVNANPLGATTEGTGSYTTGATNTATKLNLSLRETPQTVSVMTRQRIDDQALSSVTEVLQQSPGVSVQSMGSERFNVYSRGYPISSYQIDGIKTTAEIQTQDVSQSLADMAIYDRVEVLRGASGLMNGAGDPSGTLNMVRKRPTSTFQGHVAGAVGSWNKYRGELDVSGPLTETGNVRGRFVSAYQQSDSFIDVYQQEKQVLYGVLEGDLSETDTLTAGISYQKDDPRGVFGGVGNPLFYSNGQQTSLSRAFNIASRDNTNQVDAYNLFSNYRKQFNDDWALNVSGNYLYSKRDYQWVMGAVWSGFPNQVTGAGLPLYTQQGNSHQDQAGLDARLEGAYQVLGRKHTLVMGLNYTDSHTKTDTYRETGGLAGRTPFNLYTWNNSTGAPVFGAKFYDNDTDIRERGYYLATRLNITDALNVILGARVSDYDRHYTYVNADAARSVYDLDQSSRKHGVLTPYAGITYDLNEQHTLYASYATIFMPQAYRDRTGTVLDPREGDTVELGLKSAFYDGRVNTAIALYQINQDNLAVADGDHSVPGYPLETAYRAADGRTQGVDLEVTGEVLPDWNVMASYTYGRTEDEHHAPIQTIMPEHMAKLWSTYKLPGQLSNLTVGGGWNWQSRIHFSYSSWMFAQPVEAEQAAYATFNLMAKYAFTPDISATLNVNNVFDKKYLSSLDQTFNSGFYGDPRNVLLSTRWAF
ncbi:TonB-dependent siderophore receptor [Pseudomonas sp. MAFF212427]|uniref:TonB-dependent siderophore receptor n=1 Tax=Pseudomonas brassicae TaxID=2708063 RepID=A0A6B3NQQ4_9PSED|nr:TonB-dependent siderophore receptor [Pseudomonas brassicae]NER62768.1 TonB-dependent siderophore receptor [Pseudomonas brassicae]